MRKCLSLCYTKTGIKVFGLISGETDRFISFVGIKVNQPNLIKKISDIEPLIEFIKVPINNIDYMEGGEKINEEFNIPKNFIYLIEKWFEKSYDLSFYVDD